MQGVYQTLNRIVIIIAMIGFIGMLISTWAQVLFRKIGVSIDWTEELSRVLFILSVFLGIAIAIKENKHIVVNFLFNRLPPFLRLVFRVFFSLIILVFLASLLRGAITLTSVTWESYMIAMTWLRTGHLYLWECIAIVLMMFYVLIGIGVSIRSYRDDLNERTGAQS